MGKIGKRDADFVFNYLETAIRDPHQQVTNAVMSSLKIMGEKNPKTTLKFVKMFIQDQDPEVQKKLFTVLN